MAIEIVDFPIKHGDFPTLFNPIPAIIGVHQQFEMADLMGIWPPKAV